MYTYNALSGREALHIAFQKAEQELQGYTDFSGAIAYDNPRFTIHVILEAQEIEPVRAEVSVQIPTGDLPEGTRGRPKSTRITATVGPMLKPDKERAEAGLVVPNPVRNEDTGEVADYKANEQPF